MDRSSEALRAELAREVRQFTGLGVSYFRAVAGRVGMNATDVEVVAILRGAGPATAGQLAELTGLTTGAITQMLDRLEAAGLVRRNRDPDDGRRVVVRLAETEGATPEVGATFEAVDSRWEELATQYDDAQLAALVAFLKRANALYREEIARLREGPREDTGAEFSVALGNLATGRLVFTAGASHLTLHADGGMDELYRARFDGPAPDVKAEGGIVTIRYPRARWLLPGRAGRAADIALNAAIPWQIEVRGGASDVTAELDGLRLAGLEVGGGMSMVRVALPEPVGTVPIRISGGAMQVTIRRPPGAAARVRLKGWASALTFDDQNFGYTGKDVRLQSPDYEGATGRYDVEVSGSASMFTVGFA